MSDLKAQFWWITFTFWPKEITDKDPVSEKHLVQADTSLNAIVKALDYNEHIPSDTKINVFKANEVTGVVL